jgi:hypothetical protein
MAFVTRVLILRKKRSNNASDHPVNESGTPIQSAEADATSNAIPGAFATVLGAWAVTAEGEEQAFLEALKEKRRRPRPDPTLCDSYGFPVRTTRIEPLSLDQIDERLNLSTPSQENTAQMQESSIASMRTMALLLALIDQVANAWPFDFDAMLPAEEITSTATLRGSESKSLSKSGLFIPRIKLLVPFDFPQHEHEPFRRHAIRALQDGLPGWRHTDVDIIPAHADTTALILLKEFGENANRSPMPQALLLLACESTLCPTVADKLEAEGKLFSASTPHGLMLGEAGFGILCANDAALPFVLSPPVCRIGPVALGHRISSADAPGRPTFNELTQVASQALEGAAVLPEHVGAIACDADHRTNRTLECIGVILDLTPRLDAIEDRLATNEQFGHLGAASALGGLVAAAVQANTHDMPVLLLSLTHVLQRAAAVLLPPSQQKSLA